MPAPMLASVGDLSDLAGLCQDDRYQLEQKCDGRRLLCLLSDGVVTGFNRRGETTDVPNAVVAQLLRCPIDIVIDGELLPGGVLWVFDLPEAHNAITPAAPLRLRRAALETLVRSCGWTTGAVHLLPAAATTEAKTLLAQRVIEAGAEGLMAKNLEGAYLYGKRGSGMRKLKLTKTVDAVVIGFSAHGHDSLSLGLFDDHGDLVPIGEVTRQAGDGARLREGDVACVSYLYWTGSRLVQPTKPMRRGAEKAARECTMDQLVVARTKDVVEV